MAFDLQDLGRSEAWRGMSVAFGRSLARSARLVFITYSHLADLLAVAIVLLVAVYLVVILLYVAPPGLQLSEPEVLQLDQSLIDRLVQWTEERSRSRTRDFTVSSSAIFP